ncbi:MAG: hypothetical protein LC732_05725 [Acidobacteria bacterium]|nr:hypothetical protein [Acidobacteriota bacterium]
MRVLAAALLAVALVPVSLQAEPASATIQVSARVIGRTIITVESEPQVTITEADLARGWVDVADPTILSVKSNQRAGFRLAFAPSASWLAGGEVIGLSDPLVFAAAGAAATFSYAGVAPRQLELRWRLDLSPDATAGTFPLPVSFATLN